MEGQKSKYCAGLTFFSVCTCHCVKRPSEEIKQSTWLSISLELTWSHSCLTTKSKSSHRKISRWSRSLRVANFILSVLTLQFTGRKMREASDQGLTKSACARQTTNFFSIWLTNPRTRCCSKKIAENPNQKATNSGSNLHSCFGMVIRSIWQASAHMWWWARKMALSSSNTRLITKVRSHQTCWPLVDNPMMAVFKDKCLVVLN